MNPHVPKSISPLGLYRTVHTHRSLIYSLIKREVVGRYRGSTLGLLWSFFNPLLMLAVYTFVFSVVFQARWSGGSGSKVEFALVLFSGLLLFNLFSECANRAPQLIISNVNYVKKVVFPLEILPIVSLGAAGFHFAISLLVWLIFYVIFFGLPPVSILLLPILILPFLLFILGVSWFLSALAVYIRDVGQVVGLGTMVLMYLSPIFYPASILPPAYRAFIQISPLTVIVEQARDLMLWGKGMNWTVWSLYSVVALLIAWLGFAWFQKTRKGFADVL